MLSDKNTGLPNNLYGNSPVISSCNRYLLLLSLSFFIAVNVDMLDFHSNVYHRLKLNDRLLVKETC